MVQPTYPASNILPPPQGSASSGSGPVPPGVGGVPDYIPPAPHPIKTFFSSIWKGISWLVSWIPFPKKVEVPIPVIPGDTFTVTDKESFLKFLEKMNNPSIKISVEQARKIIKDFRIKGYTKRLAECYFFILNPTVPQLNPEAVYDSENLSFAVLYRAALYLSIEGQIEAVKDSNTPLREKLPQFLDLIPNFFTQKLKNRFQIKFCYLLHASNFHDELKERMIKIDREEYQGKLGFANMYQDESLFERYLKEGKGDFNLIRSALERWLYEVELADLSVPLNQKLELLSKNCSPANFKSFISIPDQKQELEKRLNHSADYDDIPLNTLKECIIEWKETIENSEAKCSDDEVEF